MLALVFAACLDLCTEQQPAARLRIKVLDGENAVNVIQQKTAVAPLVEVRDQNGLPVAGATVTFTLTGGNLAAFPGGVSTITAVTNGAGQAAAAAITPLSSGTF